MSLDRALREELLRLLRTDPDVQREVRKIVGGGDADGFMTVSAAATFADVAPSTVRKWIADDKLAAVGEHKARRVRRADLVDFLRRRGGGDVDLDVGPLDQADAEDRWPQ